MAGGLAQVQIAGESRGQVRIAGGLARVRIAGGGLGQARTAGGLARVRTVEEGVGRRQVERKRSAGSGPLAGRQQRQEHTGLSEAGRSWSL